MEGDPKGTFELKLTRQAERVYRRLDSRTRRRIDRVFELFEQGRFSHPNVSVLHGPLEGKFRYRLGKWRIVFSIDYKSRTVWIETITTRGGAYR